MVALVGSIDGKPEGSFLSAARGMFSYFGHMMGNAKADLVVDQELVRDYKAKSATVIGKEQAFLSGGFAMNVDKVTLDAKNDFEIPEKAAPQFKVKPVSSAPKLH